VSSVRIRAIGAIGIPIIAALVFVLVGLSVGGSLTQKLLVDAGPFVRAAQPIARVLFDLSMATAIGTLVLAAWGLPANKVARALDIASVGSVVWAVSGALSLLWNYLVVAGVGFSTDNQFGAGLWMFITQVQLGQLLGYNLLAAIGLSVLALAVRSQIGTGVLAGLSLISLLPIALSGHASGTSGHAMAVNAMGLHLVSVSIWVGGLIALLLFRAFGLVSLDLVKRYSTLALVGFGLMAASGVSSATLRIHSFAQLLSAYGLLVLAKVGLLAILGVIGFWHRRRLIASGVESNSRFWRLAAVEVAVMGAAIGIATALSKTAPPVSQNLNENPSPAQILTGEPLPPEFTPIRWFTEYKLDLLWMTIAVLGIVGYLYGVRRLRQRGDSWSLGRTASWVVGMLLLAYITSGPMNVYEEYLFSTHMIAHMMLTMGVPLFLVPAAPVTLLLRASAKRLDGSMGLREWVLWAVETRWAKFVSHPLTAAVLFASSLVVFYYTPLMSWSVHDHIGHEWMIVHFLITGYLFVQALVGVDPGPPKVGYPIRLMLLVGTLTFHAFFGLALMTGNGLLLADWYGAMGRSWGQNPLDDQQTGGAIAWGIGELPAAALTLIVSIQWSRADKKEATRLDRASDRGGNKDLEEYNAMFEQLAKREERRR